MEFRLINFMKENNFMYDRSAPLYKCKTTKEQKWLELSKELGVGVLELQKRWRTLRDRFKREDKKYAQSGGSRIIKWKYYELLGFLKGYCYETEAEYLKNEEFASQSDEPYDHQYAANKNIKNITLSAEALFSNACTTEQRLFSKRKKVQTDELSKREILLEFSTLLDKARGNLSTPSMVKAFFNSMVIQIEEANLSFERFAYIQQEVLRIVNEQIKGQRQEQSANGETYQTCSEV